MWNELLFRLPYVYDYAKIAKIEFFEIILLKVLILCVFFNDFSYLYINKSLFKS